ncbi:hypothetical protein [Arthrobacter agilis]|uniref:hypothetical protein n=1 Tax=Arthrobacter agilis TaxID=37921 RepID=UPI0027815A05|nr:hypothetical protein [Arthrobacter agilis]MDQ0734406.1 uncharacterized protein (TIGR03382 family) [Arthrobacter agilis]
MPHTGAPTDDGRHGDQDALRVPFWIVLAGVGVGAFWALAGVAVGAAVTRRRHAGGPPGRTGPPWAAGRR